MEGPREAALRCRDLGHSGRSAMGRDDLTLLRPEGFPQSGLDDAARDIHTTMQTLHAIPAASPHPETSLRGATGGGEPPGFAAGPPAG